MRISENFSAGVPKRYYLSGSFFCFDSVPGGSVDAVFAREGRKLPDDLIGAIGGWFVAPAGGFDEVEVTSSLTQTLSFYVVRGMVRSNTISGSVTVTNFPAVQPVSGPLTDAQLRATAVPVSGPLTDAQQRALGSTLHVTATAAVNTGSTATLPTPGAGLFHYITRIELRKRYSIIGVAAGAGVLITTTNLPGGPSIDTEQLAAPAGTVVPVIEWEFGRAPLKSSVANTATTFVAPAQLQTIWRWNVSYYTGA